MRNADDHPRSLDAGSATASEDAATHVLDESAATGGSSSKPKAVPHFTPAERAARGKAAPAELPRSAHAAWESAPSRRDPIDLLEAQVQTRPDQNERDYRALQEAVASGRVAAEQGV